MRRLLASCLCLALSISSVCALAADETVFPDPRAVFGALADRSLVPEEHARYEHARHEQTPMGDDVDQSALRAPWSCPKPTAAIRVDLEPDRYTPRNGYWFAWLALQGYAGQASFPNLRRTGFTEMSAIADKATSLRGYIASTPEFTVVSFSGSADAKDLLTDLTFEQTRDERWGVPGRLHKGFIQAIDPKWSEIMLEVARQSQGRKPVYVTGHSLGGAMAILAAARLTAMDYPVAGVYLFAVPRVGDETFATFMEDRLGSRTWRFNFNEDIIPHLAPSSESTGEFIKLLPKFLAQTLGETFREAAYRQIGKLFRFDKRGGLTGPFPEDAADERAYWTTIHERSQGKSLLAKILLNWRAAVDHIPATSYCYFNRPL